MPHLSPTPPPWSARDLPPAAKDGGCLVPRGVLQLKGLPLGLVREERQRNWQQPVGVSQLLGRC